MKRGPARSNRTPSTTHRVQNPVRMSALGRSPRFQRGPANGWNRRYLAIGSGVNQRLKSTPIRPSALGGRNDRSLCILAIGGTTGGWWGRFRLYNETADAYRDRWPEAIVLDF
jgi:hypothetical protein